jgi:hypothetical protein
LIEVNGEVHKFVARKKIRCRDGLDEIRDREKKRGCRERGEAERKGGLRALV